MFYGTAQFNGPRPPPGGRRLPTEEGIPRAARAPTPSRSRPTRAGRLRRGLETGGLGADSTSFACFANLSLPVNYSQILSLPARPTPYAVLGSPITHSFSPIMQQAAFDFCGIEARYYRIEVPEDKLAGALAHLRAVSFGGWNCTIPLKTRMFELCDHRAESAEIFGTVNTVVNEKGTLTGHSTDGLGWSRALREAFDRSPADLRILVLGAGGAGRAIAIQALLENCPRLVIANRNAGRARALADELEAKLLRGSPGGNKLSVIAWDEIPSALREIDLIVNATSTGLEAGAPSVLPAQAMNDKLLVFDTVYGAGCVNFRKETEAAGARWSDGLGMLLHQGAAAFSLWTGREAPVESMREALQVAFSASRR
jgi:shikimate dehydrogenase